MYRTTFFLSILSLLVQTVSADIRSDILALTGNRQVKIAWVRTTWCDANYNPIASMNGKEQQRNQMMVLNTSESAGARVLDPEGDHGNEALITFKDGSQVIWTDATNKCAWIKAFDGSTPKRNLNLGADYLVGCVSGNPGTAEEYIYVLPVNRSTVYRIPFNPDYTLDMSKKTQVVFNSEFTNGSGGVVDGISVSADGKYMGTALPWPDTRIIEIETKKVYTRHQGQFGCNSNLAADNSYRFMHFGDDHDLVHMWADKLSETWWDIPTNAKLPGFSTTYTDPVKFTDGGCPRWTSNSQFMTYGYPGPEADQTDGGFIRENGAQYGWSAAKVKQCDPARFGHVILGKFATDYKTIQWTLVSGGDIRNDEGGGKAWVSNTAVSAQMKLVSRQTEIRSLMVQGDRVSVLFPANQRGTISLLTTTGRTAAQATGIGQTSCALGNRPAGTYVVKLSTPFGVTSQRVILSR